MDIIFFLLLLLLLVGGGVLTWWLRHSRDKVPPSPPPSPPGTFGADALAKLLAPPSPGQGFNGVLAHMIAISDAQRLLATQSFSLTANDPCIADCSQPMFNTCSAWTFLRRDLMPAIFCLPSSSKNAVTAKFEYNTPLIGLLVDPAKLQQYITGMAVTDGNTVQRICGANNQGTLLNAEAWNMFDDGADAPQVTWGSVGPNFKGSRLGSCKDIAGCGVDDAACQAVSSGNSVLLPALGVQPSIPSDDLGPATSKKDKVSFANVKAGAKPEIYKNWGKACWPSSDEASPNWPETECKLMHYSNFCARQAPEKATTTTVKDSPIATFIDDELGNAGNVVGDDGLGVLAAYVDEKTGALRHTWNATLLSCKFRRDDFDLWTNALKGYYKAWLKAYSVPSADISPPAYNIKLSPIWDGNDQNSNFLLGNPASKAYLENELNIYIHPPSAKQQLQETQNQDLRDAVVGFFFIGKTCLDFHKELNNTKSRCSWAQNEPPKLMSNAQDICQGFLCTEDPNSTLAIDQTCVADLVMNEGQYISLAQKLAAELQTSFNATYRQGKEQVGLFQYTGGSNTFFDYNTLKKWESNTLTPEDFFVEASRPPPPSRSPAPVMPINVSALPLKRQGPPPQAYVSPP